MTDLNKRVIIVGAGIIGSSIAYHLSQEHFQVTVIEKNQPASAATGSAFGWLTAAVEETANDLPLRKIALTDWHRLEQEIPDLTIRWNGSIQYTRDIKHYRAGESALQQHEIRELEPSLHSPPHYARFMPVDGSIDAKEATLTLLEAACRQGATLLSHTLVSGFIFENNKIVGVKSSQGTLEADYIVLACGIDIPTLANTINQKIPVLSSPSILLRFNSPQHVVNRIISCDDFEIRHTRNGDLLAAEDYLSDKSLTDIATEAKKLIQQNLAHTQTISLQQQSIGYRPIPEDQCPIIGFIESTQPVYVAVMHPAVTCAASIGRLVCEHLKTGIQPQILNKYHPNRFNA